MDEKKCSKCKRTLPVDQFGLRKDKRIKGSQTGKVKSHCRACESKRSAEYSRKHRLKVTKDQYNRVFERQNGLCAICHKPEITKNRKHGVRSLAVDHCHETGKIRGLLCTRCNMAIGLLKEDVMILSNAIYYLEEHK